MRSAAAIARRLAYSRSWHRAHPDYRRQRRVSAGLPVRPVRPPARPDPQDVAEAPDEILTMARQIAGKFATPDRRTSLHDDLFEDLVGTAAIALLSGHDAVAACRQEAAHVRGWAGRSISLEGNAWTL